MREHATIGIGKILFQINDFARKCQFGGVFSNVFYPHFVSKIVFVMFADKMAIIFIFS